MPPFLSRRDFSRHVLGLPLAAAISALGSAGAETDVESANTLPEGGSLTDVPGLKVGYCTLTERPTGCTVVLCEHGTVGGVDVRGSAPGTRETDLLAPINAVETVNAILLSGGSTYGLDAAPGVMRYLEERNLCYDLG